MTVEVLVACFTYAEKLTQYHVRRVFSRWIPWSFRGKYPSLAQDNAMDSRTNPLKEGEDDAGAFQDLTPASHVEEPTRERPEEEDSL